MCSGNFTPEKVNELLKESCACPASEKHQALFGGNPEKVNELLKESCACPVSEKHQALFGGNFTQLLRELYNTEMSEEDTVLLQNEIGALSRVISTDIIHTRKSREKMGHFGLTREEVIEVINDSSKVNQNDTILCNGRRVNVRLVKKDEKYLVIDLYVKT